MGIKRCKLGKSRQLRLLEYFVLEVTARSAADLLGMQANTTMLFYRKIRHLIAGELAKTFPERGEFEVDESYFGGVRKGKRGRGAAGKLHDAAIVADVAFELAEIARPRDGQIPDLSSELTNLGMRLEQLPPPRRIRGSAQLVLGSEHTDPLQTARDDSVEEITVLSHRLGVATKPVLKALSAATKARGVISTVYYGRVSGPVTKSDAMEEIKRSRAEGISLSPIEKPRIHAKVLCWDADNIVVTSLNWLSADPPTDNLRHEIGVHVVAPGVASNFRRNLASARNLDIGDGLSD